MIFVPPIVTVDGYDLSGLGFIAEALPGLRSVVDHSDAVVPVVAAPGAALLDDQPSIAVRTFRLTGTLHGTSAADLRANYRLLQYRVAGGSRILTVVDDTARRITARLQAMDFAYAGKELDTAWARVTLEWRALTPYWEDVSTTSVTLSTSNADCPLGTVPVYPVVTITGAATTPTLSYKTSAGTTKYSLTLATISAGQSVTVDMRTRTITHSVSGVSPGLRTAGRFFALDPYDGDYPTSAWPKLVLSAGSGSAVYRKGYHG